MIAKWQSVVQRMQQLWAANRYAQAGRQWYGSLTGRDQKIVLAVAACLVVALIYSLVYAPLLRARALAESQLERHQATYQLLAANAGRFSSGRAAAGNAPLLSVVTQQARTSGVALSRYEQDGQALRVWLDKVSFDDAATWLEELQSRHGVKTGQITIDQTDRAGRVDIRATLSR